MLLCIATWLPPRAVYTEGFFRIRELCREAVRPAASLVGFLMPEVAGVLRLAFVRQRLVLQGAHDVEALRVLVSVLGSGQKSRDDVCLLCRRRGGSVPVLRSIISVR